MGEAKRRQTTGQAGGSSRRRPVVWIAVGALVLLAAVVVAYLLWSGGKGTLASVEDLPEAPEGAKPFPQELDRFGVSLGEADAPVVVREFADYQCPACGQFASVAQRIKDKYVTTGQVRFVFFDFPLRDVHDNAMIAARAARCAGDQDAYWAMHDHLFEQQWEWSGHGDPQGVFVRYAEELGLNPERLERCLATELHREDVLQSLATAQRLGIRSTPTVLVDNIVLSGAQSWPRVSALIERELARAAQSE